MRAPRAMRNGLERGVMVWMRDGTRRGLSSTRVIQRAQNEDLRFLRGSIHCSYGYTTACPSRTRILRSILQDIHQTSPRHFQTSIPSRSWHNSPPAPPTTHPTTAIPLPEQLRSIMRLLTHSVVVCTSTHDATPRAMTMSSFTSLTLSPTPLITFNVATPSRTLDAITSSREFNIHILAGDAAGAAVADHFTRGNVGDHAFENLESLEYDRRAVLRGGGVLFVLRCRVLKDAPEEGLVRVRDHVIVVGEVAEMIPGEGEKEEFGLVYADRRYRTVGGVLEKDG